MCFLYAASIHSFLNHYYPNHEEQITTYVRENREIIGGLTITAVVTVATEIVTRVINCIIWSVNIENATEAFVAVWLPQGCIFILGTCINIYYHIKYLRSALPNALEAQNAAPATTPSNRCYSIITSSFMANTNIHIILPLLLTAYGLVYVAFPALILLIAYPAQMTIAIPTVIAVLFSTVIFSAIMIKVYGSELFEQNPRQAQRWKIVKFVVLRFIPLYVVLLFLLGVLIIFLYLLIIGRGAVAMGPISTFALSILPPLLLSSISWIAKKTILDQ